MLRFLSCLFIIITFSSAGGARPLELLPRLDYSDKKIYLIDWRSDLWTSPHRSKDSPVRIYDLRAHVPVSKNDTSNLFVTAGAEGLSSGRADLIVGRKRTLIGSDLRMQGVGLGFQKRFEDRTAFSFVSSYVSDSDQPHAGTGSTWFDFSASYAFAAQEKIQWIVLVNYTKNRGYLNNMIIPLVGVIHHIDSELIATYGFPFFKLAYETPDWNSTVLATFTGLKVDFIKPLSDRFNIRVLSGYSSRSYVHVNRQENDLRLYYEEKFAECGLRTKISNETFMSFSLGASIERNFYEAKQIYLPTSSRTTLPNDVYGHIRFEVHL